MSKMNNKQRSFALIKLKDSVQSGESSTTFVQSTFHIKPVICNIKGNKVIAKKEVKIKWLKVVIVMFIWSKKKHQQHY